MASGTPTFVKLNGENYTTWSGEMEAWLRASGLWKVVSGKQKSPTVSATPTAEESMALDAWETKCDKAAGWLFLMVEQEQRVHFNGIQDDPVKMWTALEAVHRQKKAGMRFNAYDDLFSIRKLEEESLQSLINRVEDCKRRIKELRPSSFTLEMLDDELASMALIRALPDDFSAFSSSLLLMDKLDKTTIHQAFVTEDIQRKKRAQDASGGSQCRR